MRKLWQRSDVLCLREWVLRSIVPPLIALQEQGYWVNVGSFAVALADRIEEGIEANAVRNGPLQPVAALLRHERLAQASEQTVQQLQKVNERLDEALRGVARGDLSLSRAAAAPAHAPG